jgi:hypothetical protein
MAELQTLVSDMVKDAEARHRENSATYFDALQQIAHVCDDNAGPACRHDMALNFIRQIVWRALPKR